MLNRLSVRWTLILFALTACILLIATATLVSGIHYHFQMVQNELPGDTAMTSDWGLHLEMAIVESILWTLLGALLLAMVVSTYVARRISAPLIEMKYAAEAMTRGRFTARIAGQSRDELGQLSQAINHLAERLQQQENLRVSMTDNIAHELRTPLTTLKSHMIALKDGIWEPTPERLESCYEEIDRLAGLVNDLQELNELGTPEFGMAFTDVWIDEVLNESIQVMQAAYHEKKVHLAADLAAGVRMKADAHRMKQVFVNLLSNALKFTPSSGRVKVELRENANYIEILVADNGIGISPDDLPYIFERFYRADKSRGRETGGSGIGLAIVRTIVEAHSGEVWAESGDKGSRFQLCFPK
ncbi:MULTISPECIES: HAMP domain-containing sensor histidine kinase [unclassified Paenibacillus]|uniref:sensor histidine kinase n=1 Tax=unclassified Paenibacillus TaxID=185978 RepID=UPI001AEABBEE|nr:MULTISPECIES: HAMP domain-containing sensor histidine kinase [unclassified Paenibacillus]MBP1154665.1 signal transduction histidine kinase [Paenibacillus sp. PvP091]MBP1169951.1 signal transduction histidine kinase [Paenibacillus sp. PvR098]MBP2440979.1 signal transduction histidine kinase [Paenibacillus sp. PvP052]